MRDNALAVAGLLSAQIGGPSVKPYQPEGYWENLNFPVRHYVADTGANQYRRGLYTWWQRSFLHPSLLAFDAPSREECCAERNRSNIPQQALVQLNDPTYVEAARVFATRILGEGGAATPDRLTWAWQRALQRSPRAEEIAKMTELRGAASGDLPAEFASRGRAGQDRQHAGRRLARSGRAGRLDSRSTRAFESPRNHHANVVVPVPSKTGHSGMKQSSKVRPDAHLIVARNFTACLY